MKKVTLIKGNRYIGYGMLFDKGDVAVVEDDVGENLLEVIDTRGRFRFKEGAVDVATPDKGRGDLSAADFVPATNQGIKDRLNEMGVEFAPNANKATLTKLYNEAIAAPDSDEDDAPDDSDGDVTL